MHSGILEKWEFVSFGLALTDLGTLAQADNIPLPYLLPLVTAKLSLSHYIRVSAHLIFILSKGEFQVALSILVDEQVLGNSFLVSLSEKAHLEAKKWKLLLFISLDPA